MISYFTRLVNTFLELFQPAEADRLGGRVLADPCITQEPQVFNREELAVIIHRFTAEGVVILSHVSEDFELFVVIVHFRISFHFPFHGLIIA